MDTIEISMRCPLCGEVGEYGMKKSVLESAKDPNKLIIACCPCCKKVFARYAYALFGGGDSPR